MTERPFLTARWTNLVLLNFVVPANLIERIAPPGTKPDLYDGRAYVSIVGFRFEQVRIFGLRIPMHASFDEINLRYYVRRKLNDEIRHGVVFVREIAARRAVALAANHMYHEHYIVCPVRSSLSISNPQLRAGDSLEYGWRSYNWQSRGPFQRGLLPRGRRKSHWNLLAARVDAPLAQPTPNSLDEFIIEHYFGYSHGRDGHTREYRVAHPPWRVASATNVVWECDTAATYGPPFAEYLAVPPAHTLIAEGSDVEVFRGRLIRAGVSMRHEAK